MGRAVRLSAIFLAVGIALPPAVASAEPLTAAQLPAPGQWKVSRGERECVLAYRNERSPHPVLALRTLPGTRLWQIRFAGALPRQGYLNARRLTVRLQSSGAPVEGEGLIEPAPGGRDFYISRLPDDLLERVASAELVTLARGTQPLVQIAPSQAAEAIAAARACVDAALREWGIDPIAFAAVRTPPEGDIVAVVRDGDYPISAITEREQGTVIVRLGLDEAGRVTDCRPVVSSGHEILDRRACVVFTHRLRMSPAFDAEGRPIPTALITSLVWYLPRY